MITIPTLAQLYNSILTDLESTFGENIPTFGKNYLRAQAAVQAAKLKLYYLAIGNLQKNIFIDTADSESLGGTLERFGRVKLGRNPFPATAGKYDIEVAGSIGGIIPAGQTFKSNDDSLSPGKLFILDIAYTLVSATDTINVRALEAGASSRLENGDVLTATSPIALVNKTGTVTNETVTPEDSETLEDYRRKALDAYRLEPQGGAATDYRLWSYDAQGVKQTYPYARSGDANEINVFVEANPSDSLDGKGTPSQGILDDVEAVIEFDPDTSKPLNERGRRPLGVFEVHVLPISVLEIDIVIEDYDGITPAINTAITNALRAQINLIRPFVAAADILSNKNDILNINKIISIVLDVEPGAQFGDIIMNVNGVSENTHTFIAGDIPNLNSVTIP